MSVAVSISDLQVSLGGRSVLDRVTLDVEPGSFVSLLGPSGSGKTTTLNVLAGFVRADGGQVRLGGTEVADLPPHRRDIGLVFQNYALFPHLSVRQNVEFPLLARKVDRARRRRLADEMLDLVQLPGLGGRRVSQLSGGQQQRVALARALVFGPSLLLLDEPLAALDKQLREVMQIELKRIQERSGVTAIAVTHDQVEALSLADQVAIMRDGRLEQVGTPEEVYRRPTTEFVARFLGEANLLPTTDGRVAALTGRSVAATGTTVIRPEDLQVAAHGPGLGGTVGAATFQGVRWRLSVDTPGAAEPLVVSVAAHEVTGPPTPGDAVQVSHRGGDLHVLATRPVS